MRRDTPAKPLSHVDRNLLSIFCCFLIITTMWLGVCLNNSSMALTKPMGIRIAEEFNGAIASQPTVMNDLKNQVEDDLKEESDSATGDRGFASPVAGKARSAIGRSKHSFDHSAKQVKTSANAGDGQTEKTIANIQDKAASRRGVENAIEDVMSKIKNKVN